MPGAWKLSDKYAASYESKPRTWSRTHNQTGDRTGTTPEATSNYICCECKGDDNIQKRSSSIYQRAKLVGPSAKNKLARLLGAFRCVRLPPDIEAGRCEEDSEKSNGHALQSGLPSTKATTQAPEDRAPEDCTWMFAFNLPSSVTTEQEREFRRNLRQECTTGAGMLWSSFKAFVDLESIGAALGQPPPTPTTGTTPGLLRSLRRVVTTASLQPLLSEDMDEEGEDLFSRCQQCAIELVLAFFEDVLSSSCKEVVEMDEEPVKTSVFTSLNGDTLFVCVHLSIEVAELIAAADDYPVQLSTEGVSDLGISISDPRSCRAYVKYDPDFRGLCVDHPDPYSFGRYSVLRPIDRIRLLYDKITDFIGLSNLKVVGLLVDSAPLHHHATLKSLRHRWGSLSLFFSLHQPLDEVREYFGEEIAFYFFFVHELARATLILIAPVFVCTGFMQIFGHGYARPVFSMVIMTWYRVFTKRWQQQQKLAACRWGMHLHKVSTLKELPNSRFNGKLMPSRENEETLQLQVSVTQKMVGRIISVILTGSFIVALLAMLAVEHVVFFHFSQKYSSGRAASILSFVVGSVSGIQIKIVDGIWDALSNQITDHEHRAYESTYNKSKRVKASVVKIMTSTSSMVFFAFVQPAFAVVSCRFFTNPDSPCMEHDREQLRNQLLSLFVTRYIFLAGSVHDIIQPYMALRLKEYKKGDLDESFVELQANMCEYTNTDLTDDWLDILLPLGLALFFGMIAPFSLALLLVVLLTQVRTDAWKLCHVYRRPYPRLAEDFLALVRDHEHGIWFVAHVASRCESYFGYMNEVITEDGIATILAALLGSPFGLTILPGQPAMKAMGARVGYVLLSGFCLVVVCFSGLIASALAALPVEALSPSLLLVGVAVCADALEDTPKRHWSAFLVSLVPALCTWAVQQAQHFGRVLCSLQLQGCAVDVSNPSAWMSDARLHGLWALSRGYLLSSVLLAGMLALAIDREFVKASCWAFVAAVSAACGFTHSAAASLPWRGDVEGSSNPIRLPLHWRFVVAYLGGAVLFGACAILQRRGKVPRGPAMPTSDEARDEVESITSTFEGSLIIGSRINSTPLSSRRGGTQSPPGARD